MLKLFNAFLVKKMLIPNPYSMTYGLGRSLIALGTLLVFIFNDFHLLFDEKALNILSNSEFVFNKFSFFAFIGYEKLWLSKILSITILIMVISGFVPRITGLLHFWISYSFYHSAVILDGGDQIAVIFSFLLIPLTILDRRINHWNKEVEQSNISKFIGNISFIFISLQTSFIYLNTAIEKLYAVEEWKKGTALYYFLRSNYYGVNDFFSKIIYPLIDSKLVFFLTWFVIISHLVISYTLFLDRNKRKYFIYVGVILHIFIALLMGLHSFSIVMIGVLSLYMLPFNFKFRKI